MNNRKLIKTGIIVALTGIVIAGAIALYMFNMPHRNVQSAKSDFTVTASAIVNEYLSDKNAANKKYLAANGDSKILEVTGEISKISEDFNGQKVVLLKSSSDKAGVSATFTAETNTRAASLQKGQTATIKGVIRSGAAFDEDLELYEHVILDKSDLVIK